MTKRIYPSPGKIYTKSEITALVAAGQNTEVFHHTTMGIFNAALPGVRDIIARFPTRFPIHRIAFSKMSAPPELAIPQVQVMDWIFSQREICPKRLAELTDEQLDDPAIDLVNDEALRTTSSTSLIASQAALQARDAGFLTRWDETRDLPARSPSNCCRVGSTNTSGAKWTCATESW